MQSFNWFLDDGKFLTDEEVSRLKEIVEARKKEALANNWKTAVRDWFVVNLGLYTGIRVQEMSNLKMADVIIVNGSSSLVVRHGKYGKGRLIRFSRAFKDILIEYEKWKMSVGESLEAGDPVIYSTNSKGAMTTRGIQKIFERSAKRAGIVGHSIHHLRHTYASHLYRASRYNLRMVQKQLGHSTIKITEVYADVLNPDIERALNDLYN